MWPVEVLNDHRGIKQVEQRGRGYARSDMVVKDQPGLVTACHAVRSIHVRGQTKFFLGGVLANLYVGGLYVGGSLSGLIYDCSDSKKLRPPMFYRYLLNILLCPGRITLSCFVVAVIR